MFSRIWTAKSIGNYSEQLEKLKNELATADAIVIGAGAGLSLSAGFSYDGERFERHFSYFHKKYGFTDMYSGGFYPYNSPEEYWAWWSRHILLNRYEAGVGKSYADLLKLLKDKEYFVLTTNVDHQFQLSGFPKNRLFYTQGDYGLWQCSVPCHDQIYDNEEAVRQMVAGQKDMKVPTELIPKCPVCQAPMTMNLRCDGTFVQDRGWFEAASRYSAFLRRYKNAHILFWELGVGFNTPAIIKYPFWQMTAQNPNAVYACVNLGESCCPSDIMKQAICISGDIGKTICSVAEVCENCLLS